MHFLQSGVLSSWLFAGTSLSDWAERREGNTKEGNTRLIKRQKRRDRSTTDSNAALKKKAQEEDGDDTDSSFFDDMDTEDEAEDLC